MDRDPEKTEAMVPKTLYGYFYRLFGSLTLLSRQTVGWTSPIILFAACLSHADIIGLTEACVMNF
jgi:hypothetical protein